MGGDVQVALRHLADGTRRFGWVFLDPPYSAGAAGPALEIIAGSGLLANGGMIVVEHDKRRVPPDSVGTIHLTDRRFYGDTGVSFYRREAGLS
jgi:16S rRNA G966 N2-methylase RsmD